MAAVLFYSAINFGFLYPHESQINQAYWVDALFNYNLKVERAELKALAGERAKAEEPSDNHLIKEIKLPINLFHADSLKTDTTSFRGVNAMTDTAMYRADSLLALRDTLKPDSMSLDSTARLKYFKFERQDIPYVKLSLGNQSAFFTKPAPTIAKRTISIDSTGKYVEIKQEVAGQQTKILLRMPIDEYLKAQLALNDQQMWSNLTGQYELKSSKKELGEFIKDFTNFEIPLPSVGVLSIFGKPTISLRIGGAVDIHGAWRNETTQGFTTSALGNTRNEPDFQQQVQINVNGTIGDKLNISADWNTERTFEYQNQLKIKYTGYEDEIIQSIEAGNVSLQTSPLVGGSEALFGVKAQFKMGPLTLTTLASQKKGEIKEVSVNSGATSQTFSIRPYNYATNNYFIDTIYANTSPQLNTFEKYYGNATPQVIDSLRVIKIEVWKSKNGLTYDQSKERQVNAYINLPPTTNPSKTYYDPYRSDTSGVPGEVETGRFVLLTPDVDYTLHPETGYITFNTQIQDNDAIAVAYEIPGRTGGGEYFGEFLDQAPQVTSTNQDSASNQPRIVLKLIKPANLKPQYTQAWKLQLKNIYALGGTNIKQDGFDFQIKYEVPGADPVSDLATSSGTVRLLNAFGLDKYDASGNPNPDGVFDWRPDLTILPSAGEIIFPTLEPFGHNFPSQLPDSLRYQAVYDTSSFYAQQVKQQDRWELTGKYSGEATSVYQLGFNIVENSVNVTLNGRTLTPNVDYTVDYNIGQLTILNKDALVPGANLKISYEQNDLFQLASKTLLGMRGIIDFSPKTKLGFSMLNLNQQTLSTKVRIGEEPISNTIMGVDFNTSADLPFLTAALDHVISTSAMSSISLAGEVAHMSPDPNTMKSTIPDDNGQSIAYIDDFEGAKKIIPVGVSYTGWKDLSAPDSIPSLAGLSYMQMMDYKAKAFWFSITPSDVVVKNLWGNNKQVATTDQNVPVMDYVFLPDTPGTYNYNPKLSDPTKTWGGMMKVLSTTANNLQEQNIQYIEFWFQVDQAPANSDLYIDLGRISEDVIPNKILNTEDKNNNGVVDASEDIGIDGMTNAQEKAFCVANGYPAADKADPSGDDFSWNPSASGIYKYFNINGTEGNGQNVDIGRIPDTEDLNLNGNLDLVNSYFRYKVPLDTSKLTNPYIAGGGEGLDNPDNNKLQWYLLRIPLSDTMLTVGQPTLSDVEYIRVFTTDVSSMIHVRLAEFNLVGNQWQQVLPNDTVMKVSVINVQDNPNYSRPPGLVPEQDKTQPNQNVILNEQSLDLIINGLDPGQARETVKYMYKPLDLFNYKQLKFFIHGDQSSGATISDTTGGGYTSKVYLKFGTDTTNFYMYEQPVKPGWNDVTIDFGQLTAIKQALDSINTNTLYLKPTGEPGHFYGVQGNPSLTSVKYFLVGIQNITNTRPLPETVSGDLWVDELRVVGADNHPGWAYTVASTVKLADLMTVNFNMSRTDPYFHRLSDQFGTRNDASSWSLSTDIDLLKLLPFNMPGSNLKLSYTHQETVAKPLYKPGTDILVSQAAAEADRQNADTSRVSGKKGETGAQIISESQTINVSDSWSASNIALRIPTSSWLVQNTFNALNFGFNYNKTFGRSPTILASRSWIWNANMNYAVNFSPENYFYPANIPVIGTIFSLLSDYRNTKIYFTPQNISFTASAKRNRATTINRQQNNTVSQQITNHDFSTQRGFNMSWKLTDGGLLNLTSTYGFTINSSLAYLESDSVKGYLPEYEVWHKIFGGAFFGRPYQYSQSFDLRSSPRLPSLWNIDRYFQLSGSYSVNYQWNNNFSQGIYGKSAGFNNRSQVSLRLALKSLMDPLFKEEEPKAGGQTFTEQQRLNREQQLQRENPQNRPGNEAQSQTEKGAQNQPGKEGFKSKEGLLDTVRTAADTALAKQEPKISPFKKAYTFFKTITHILLFDYESININFSNDNTVTKSALSGNGTGFANFWGLSYNPNNGPSRLFMLGLSSSVGKRAPGLGSLTDAFSQKNSIDLQTSRPLWEGAKIDIKWNVGWAVNKSTTLASDADVNTAILFLNETGTITRSFLSLPPTFFLSVFKSGIDRVHELYDPKAANPQASLSSAFVEGFESLPLFSRLSFLKSVSNYIPRPNWSISWDGLEKFSPFKSFAERVSIDHAYTSGYSEGWYIDPTNGNKVVQTQRINYGFTPLIGLNITFVKLWEGNLTGSVKYSTQSSYDLGLSTQNITESFSKDIGITAGYSKQGFSIPLFGLSLKNDIEFSFSYTNSQSSTIIYNMNDYKPGGIPQDGTSRITMEPRVKYTISSKVTLSIFYTRTSIQPVGASRVPPSTSNEAGLDVHISIQ